MKILSTILFAVLLTNLSCCATIRPVDAYLPYESDIIIETFTNIPRVFLVHGVSVAEITGEPRGHSYPPFNSGLIIATGYTPKSSTPFSASTFCIQSPNGIRFTFDQPCSYFGFTRIGNTLKTVPGLTIIARNDANEILTTVTGDPFPPQQTWEQIAENAQFMGFRSSRCNIKTIDIIPQPPFDSVSIVYGQIDNITFRQKKARIYRENNS